MRIYGQLLEGWGDIWTASGRVGAGTASGRVGAGTASGRVGEDEGTWTHTHPPIMPAQDQHTDTHTPSDDASTRPRDKGTHIHLLTMPAQDQQTEGHTLHKILEGWGIHWKGRE